MTYPQRFAITKNKEGYKASRITYYVAKTDTGHEHIQYDPLVMTSTNGEFLATKIKEKIGASTVFRRKGQWVFDF